MQLPGLVALAAGVDVEAPPIFGTLGEGSQRPLEFAGRDGVDLADVPGETYYPPNDGFGGLRTAKTMKHGELVDRYGTDYGRYVSPAGTPPEMRALPPGALDSPFSTFRVLQSFDVESGLAAPWFDQPGGGEQIYLPQSVKWLIDNGFLERVQ
jgi:hypothetical protein